MFVQQFFVEGLSHSSYLLGSGRVCAIVDPARDIEMYLEAAEEMGMKITHILETHLHADFVSGHVELAEMTGAPIYVSRSADCEFDHVPLNEGDIVEIDDLKIEVIETPGHTPEGVCYVVKDTARGNDPVSVFTGDTLFVGDVGRPDLFPNRSEELASELYDSLHDKLLKLPDFCEVYPAHGAGSLCGRSIGAKRVSTIGYEKKYNSVLNIEDRDEFIRSLTTSMPPAPDHFSRCTEINRAGPEVRDELPIMESMDPGEFKNLFDSEASVVVDTRNFEAFGGAHIPKAYSLDLGGNFSTFAGWVVPPDRNILLVCNDEYDAEEALIQLRRVGLDNVVAHLNGGMYSWMISGYETDHVAQVSPFELDNMSRGSVEINIVDVRSKNEFDVYHIDGAVNIPVHELRTRYSELDRSLPTVTICGSGHRSSLGSSLLKQKEFKEVVNAGGGMTGFTAAGLAPECPLCRMPHGPRFLGKEQELTFL